jgi:HD superfamily phosphohydrolase YqeK
MHMVSQESISELKSWFAAYVKTFRSDDPDYQRNIDLKEEHTRRVCNEILDVGKSLGLDNEDLHLAEVIGLFHDVGRFEQYDLYGTFSDPESEDHALLGVRVLRKNGVLKTLDQKTRDLILRAVSYHNRATLPTEETKRCLFFTKLLRDADKLDIWRVVTDYYREMNSVRNGVIELGLPDTPEISQDVYTDMMAGRIVRTTCLKTLNDFKVLQMGWIYDVNFPRTFQLVRERGYLEKILDVLPRTREVSEIYSVARSCLEENCLASPGGPILAESNPKNRHSHGYS